MPFKRYPANVKAAAQAGNTGEVEAIVSVFSNRDAAREVVTPGAFTKSLAKRTPKFVFGHDWKWPLGKTLEARELQAGAQQLPPELVALGGLYAKGSVLMDDPEAARIHAHLKFGSLDEFSIGYHVVRGHKTSPTGEERPADDFDLMLGVPDGWTLHLDEIDLFEWSPVLVGMNDRTQLLSVKSADGRIDGLDVGALYESVIAQLSQLRAGAKALLVRREKEGRVLSGPNVAKLEGVATSLEEDAALLRELVASATPQKSEDGGGKGAGGTDANRHEVIAMRNRALRLASGANTHLRALGQNLVKV